MISNITECHDNYIEDDRMFTDLIILILTEEDYEVINDIFDYLSVNIVSIVEVCKEALLQIFQLKDKFKVLPKFHIFISSVICAVVKGKIDDFQGEWIDALMEALISGFAAIESETISFSGSSLIKLLKWNNAGISKLLTDHVDFVSILTADMCAMFSRIEEVGSAPFIRIVRFCELLIDVSDHKSGLENKIIKSVETEFIAKLLKTTLKSSSNTKDFIKLSNEILKVCHRGNELVKPIIGQVITASDIEDLRKNVDFIEILSNERSRNIPEIVKIFFTTERNDELCDLVIENTQTVPEFTVSDTIYRKELKKQLESFEYFKVTKGIQISSLNPKNIQILKDNRQVLLNWLPYIVKCSHILTNDPELELQIDISRKMAELLDL